MSRIVFALTALVVGASVAAADYLPWPYGPGFYVMGSQALYPSCTWEHRDMLWHDNTPVRPARVIRRAVPNRPTQIKVEAPEETQVVFGDVSAKPVNGVLVVDLKSMTQPTTVNLVIRDSGKQDLVLPIAMTPGSRPQVLILN
jgi:hypothetical protein